MKCCFMLTLISYSCLMHMLGSISLKNGEIHLSLNSNKKKRKRLTQWPTRHLACGLAPLGRAPPPLRCPVPRWPIPLPSTRLARRAPVCRVPLRQDPPVSPPSVHVTGRAKLSASGRARLAARPHLSSPSSGQPPTPLPRACCPP
jgi:hypothetical protein